jgi:hypothetical protein
VGLSGNLVYGQFPTLFALGPLYNLSSAPTAASTGTPINWNFNATNATHTGLTGSSPDVYLNLGRVVTFANSISPLATQSAVLTSVPTYAFSGGAGTITAASGYTLGGAPIAGTNATITNSYGFFVNSNNVSSGGGAVTTATSLAVETPTGATANFSQKWINAGGTTTLGQMDANGNLTANVLGGMGSAPILSCAFSGAGSGATCSLNATATDMSGVVTVTTGSAPAINSELFSITFANTHTSAPGTCQMQIVGPALAVTQQPYIPVAGLPTSLSWYAYSGFTTALTATTAYRFSYICM